MSNRFKYILIGDPANLQEIGHYPEKGTSKKIVNEAHEIFSRFCSSGEKVKDERNKINAKDDGIYYFTISSQNIFLMVLTEQNVRERTAFELLNNIQNENIHLLTKEGIRELNTVGKQQLKLVVENFKENNGSEKIEQINIEIDDAKDIMKNNIKDMTENIDKVGELENKAVMIEQSANDYNKQAVALRKATWWANCKWTIILIIVIILLIAIILPIGINLGKKNDKDKNNENNNNDNNNNSNTNPKLFY